MKYNSSKTQQIDNKKRNTLKDFKKTLTAPLDIFFGYTAYSLDLGASFFWIGKKL